MMSENEIISCWHDQENVHASILCPTFNHDKFIAKAIEGFLSQRTKFSFEIVIFDDASEDSTSSIVLDYVEKYPHIIRYVKSEQNNYSKGKRILSIVLPMAKGKYIAFCEGDDFWNDPNKLQKQIEFLESNPDYVLSYHSCQPFNELGNIEFNYGGAEKDLTSFELKCATPIYTLTACFRNVVKEFPPEFQSAKFGDLFLWSLLGNFGKGKFIKEISPAYYRVHINGVFSTKSTSDKFRMLALTYAALLSYYSRIGEKDLIRHFQKAMTSSTILMVGSKMAIYVFFANSYYLAKSKFHKLKSIFK